MSPDDLKRLEQDLKRIRPRPVDPQLAGRIEAGLKAAAWRKRLARLRSSAGWAGLAIAACVLITFGFLLFNGRLSLDTNPVPEPVAVRPVVPEPEPDLSQPPQKNNPFKQVLTENSLQNRIDEGIVFLRNGMTARRYRYQFVDRVVWENSTDGAMVELEVPRDEIVLIPVQTF